MTIVIKAPCGCACTMFVDGERQRVIHQSWCRTKGHRTMGAGHVIPTHVARRRPRGCLVSPAETAARAAYEMQRAVIQHRAGELRQAPEAERAYPAWDALPFTMREEFVKQAAQDIGDESTVFERYFVGAARMTSNMLAELSPRVLVAEHPEPLPPRPEAA